MGKVRLAVIVTHPIQYHACQWRALASDPELDVEVLFCDSSWAASGYYSREFRQFISWDVPLLQGYPHKIMKTVGRGRPGTFLSVINPDIWRRLMTERYDAVFFHATNFVTHLLGMLLARVTGKAVLVHSICYELDRRSRHKALLRGLAYRSMYLLPSKCLYLGVHNRQHYRNHGVPERKLLFVPHPVDNEFFARAYGAWRNRQDEIKEAFGIATTSNVLLFCGKLQHIKQPRLLLEAFLEADIGRNWTLLFVGDGVLRAELEDIAAQHTHKTVKFAGFLSQKEISRAYTIASVNILPSSHETWGLVVNESLNFDCAQIVSNMVGSGPDLVEGRTGEIFPFEDKEALTAILCTLATDPVRWRRYQAQARATVAGFGVREFVQGVKQALGLAGARTSAPASDSRLEASA